MSTHPIQLWELDWTFGDRLRKARRIVGLTVDEMARTLGVSKQAFNQWETGATVPRTMNSIASRLELAYQIPAWWLLGKDEPPTGPGDGGGLEVRRQGLEPRTRYISRRPSQTLLRVLSPAALPTAA